MSDGNVTELTAQIYASYTEYTEQLIERRAANNRYFLTVNTALVAVLGLAIEHAPEKEDIVLVALPVAGLLICAVWFQLTRSYRVLTKARYRVIQAMEKQLPCSPFSDEWEHIKEDPAGKGYVSIARLELAVPCIFALIYVFWVTSFLW